ncbi:MAG TPA: GNAT family N-acetyltransferase, partial [Coriobacteriia bacterium]|nr:GNAT family N-acetyltransferase [Coriobacteriia bacterium]
LFKEYHEWLGEVVCSARLAEEIASLPGPYAAPTGRLFIARDASGEPAGCIGVRPHEGARAEIKRLYVRSTARGSRLGSALIATAIEAARELGYAEALVTTLPETMPVAAGMYERLGFTEVEPFFDHSGVGETVPMKYLRLSL